jgi:hypothetical protein
MPAYLRAARLTTVLLVLGCSKQNAEIAAVPTESRPAVEERRSTTVITEAELRNSSATNLYQAVQVMRPQWLRTRGPTSLGGTARTGGEGSQLMIYMDNTRYGSVESLRSLSLQGIVELRYLDASEATNRFGTGHTMGAIVIKHAR